MFKPVIRRTALGIASVLALGAIATADRAEAEAIEIAYLSPSFDVSDAWERVYHAMRGRLDELGIEYEVQQLAVANATDHAGQLAQVEMLR